MDVAAQRGRDVVVDRTADDGWQKSTAGSSVRIARGRASYSYLPLLRVSPASCVALRVSFLTRDGERLRQPLAAAQTVSRSFR